MRAAPPTTILLVSNTAWNLAHFRRPLIEALAADGHRLVAAAAPDGHEATLDTLGVRFVPLAIDAGSLSPLDDGRLLIRLWRLLRRERPDKVMTFTVKPNIYGSIAARSVGVPAFPTISGIGSSLIAGGPVGLLVAGLFRVALAGAETTIFQNADDRHLFVSRRLVRRERTDLVPGSGIDLDKFRAVPLPDGQPVTFLMIGRMLRDKGVLEYAEAGRLLRERGVDARLKLLGAIGVNNPSALSHADVMRHCVDGSVDYLPPTDDVRSALASAHVVVLPSYREGLPMSLVEAAAMARPLIATDVPGCRDVVRDTENGFLCEPRDSRSLADAMERMLTMDPAARIRMGVSGRDHVERHFSRAAVIETYRKILGRGGG